MLIGQLLAACSRISSCGIIGKFRSTIGKLFICFRKKEGIFPSKWTVKKKEMAAPYGETITRKCEENVRICVCQTR